jgi:hypothetical protein
VNIRTGLSLVDRSSVGSVTSMQDDCHGAGRHGREHITPFHGWSHVKAWIGGITVGCPATLAAERIREVSRLEKELKDTGIKLSSVATDILGVSGRAMLTALIEGECDVHVLAEMAKARMRPKIPQPLEALTGNFADHHAFLCRLHLQRIDQLSAAILELSTWIEEAMCPLPASLSNWPPSPESAKPPRRSSSPRPAPT